MLHTCLSGRFGGKRKTRPKTLDNQRNSGIMVETSDKSVTSPTNMVCPPVAERAFITLLRLISSLAEFDSLADYLFDN